MPSTAQQNTGHNNIIEPMLVQCWADVVDGGPTLNQHCFNVSFLMEALLCKAKRQHYFLDFHGRAGSFGMAETWDRHGRDVA